MKRLAVIIGVNKYQLPGCDLRGCVPDAERYRRILLDLAGYQAHDVINLEDSEATAANIKTTCEMFVKQLAGTDSFHLIFSGHGTQTEEGNMRTDCLCPHDFDWSPERLISADYLHDLVDKIPKSCRVRVVIDACHSGHALRDLFHQPPEDNQVVVGSRSLPGSPVGRKHVQHVRFRDMVGIFPSAGFLAACRSSETASDAMFRIDGKVVFQGAMSWFLCNHLEKPNGIHTSIRKVSKAAYNDLREAGFEQHPVLRGPWEEISKGFCGKPE